MTTLQKCRTQKPEEVRGENEGDGGGRKNMNSYPLTVRGCRGVKQEYRMTDREDEVLGTGQ
jgi:hypothetical protein